MPVKQVKAASRSSLAWLSLTGGAVLVAALAPHALAQEPGGEVAPAPSLDAGVETAPAPAEVTNGADGGVVPEAPAPVDVAPAPAPEPTPAAPAHGTVGVKGRITDSDSGAPLVGATIEVIHGGTGETSTDADGNFFLDLPPGRYELRISADLYRGVRVKGVTVRGGATSVNAKLGYDPNAIEQVVVYGKADIRTESAGLERRKRSAKVEDTISAQEIARSPDSNAGEAVKRVVSATIVDGKYVFIRGLGGRYSITLLNGVPLPSPDPDNPAVPLDIFPASLLANLTVVKSYSADLPGTFSGGALLIETNTYPESFEFKLKVSGNFDSSSTGKDMLTYEGGSTDALGFDDGTRSLPSAAPKRSTVNVDAMGGMTREQNTVLAKSFDNVWTLDTRTARPNFGLSAQLGDTLHARGKKIGYLATVTYGQKLSVRRFQVAKTNLDNGVLIPVEEATIDRGEESINWGALANVGVEFDRNHSLSLFGLYSRGADDRGLFEQGKNADEDPYEKTRLWYSVRQLGFTQLTGNHHFKWFDLHWQGNLSATTRNEPNLRDILYTFPSSQMGRRYLTETPLSGERQYNDLSDYSQGAGLDVSVPASRVNVKIGTTFQNNTRTFTARRLGYTSINLNDVEARYLPPDQIFDPDLMGAKWQLSERTQDHDSYKAERLVASVFALADYKIVEPLRLIAGLRFEYADQSLRTANPVDANAKREQNARTDGDLLPGASLVYSLMTGMNLRASYSQTLARPQFRELAPFLYYDFTRRRSVTGNAELVNTSVQNADLRWEFFPGEREVLAVSAFYKNFKDPIELVIVNPSNDGLYLNAGYPVNPMKPKAETDGANVYGLEFELRGGFGRFSKRLKNFRGATNLTLIRSEIDFGVNKGSQTSAKRPLQGQSPYIFNLDAGWQSSDQRFEITFLYNIFGTRLTEVGLNDIPDIYEQAFHRLDFSASARLPADLRLKLTATNLLNEDVLVTQGPVEIQRYTPGFALGAALEWAPK